MAQFGVRTPLLRQRKVIASWTTMVVFAAALTAFALSQQGYRVEHASLNDGGIWVTNPNVGLGRENRPIQQLDARVPCPQLPCLGVDVLQDGDAVFQALGNTITPVNVATGSAPASGNVSVDGNAQRALAGGTLAALDPATGALRVARLTADPWAADGNAQNTGVSNAGRSFAKPLGDKIGAKGILAVGSDGTVYAAQGGTLITVSPNASPNQNTFGAPRKTSLVPAAAAATTGSTEQGTVVGRTFVYPTGKPGDFGVNGHTVSLGTGAALQQPSDSSSANAVFVGTADGLTAVDLSSGKPTSVFTLKDQPGPAVASQPVRLQGCTYEAWWQPLGESTILTRCDNGTVVKGTLAQSAIQRCGTSSTPLVLRTNHGQVVVNNVCNGDVWPFGGNKVDTIADWNSLVRVIKSNPHETQNPTPTRKLQAKHDDLGVRAGSEAVLHVLDNDSGPKGTVLAIDSLDTSTVSSRVHLFMSPDRQTIVAQALAGAPASVQFSYKISDGLGTSEAVDDTLRVVPADAAAVKPEPRESAPSKITYPVAVGGTVQIPVVDRWRDPKNGDPITIRSATDGAFVTPEGMLGYSPPSGAASGPVHITFTVGTGGPTGQDTATVDVITKGAKDPQLEPDVTSGTIVGGQPASITVSPLANDVPGADAADPFASLTLSTVAPAGKNSPAVGAIDASAGTFQVTASSPGQYEYSYTATFGSVAKTSTVRIVVAKQGAATPVAMPDTTTLYGNQPKTVDLLANDFDPLGRVLVLQSVQAPPNSGLTVGVVANRWLQVSATGADPSQQVTKPQTITYDVAAASGAQAQGTVTVEFGSSKDQNTPVTPDVKAVVRAGDTVSIPVLEGDSVPSGAPVGLLVPDKGSLPTETNDSGDPGVATIAGTHVRYDAPLVTSPMQVSVPYTAYNQSLPGYRQTGYARITVVPAPRPVTTDNAPTPLAIVARAIQGDTIQIKLPDLGMDPDGDSVSVTGIGDPGSNDPASTVPHRGRVLSASGNTIRYQAFPNASGTDTFSYVVTDTYGKSAAGTIRVGIAPGAAAQEPMPVDDHVQLDPHRALAYNVTANDIKTPGTTLGLAPMSKAMRGVTEDEAHGILYLAPGLGDAGSTVPFQYRLEGSDGPTDTVGYLDVTYVPDFDNPPIAGTIMAAPKAGAASVVVSLTRNVGDIDNATGLTLGSVHAGVRTAPVHNGSVTLPLLAAPTVWSYTVTDPLGARSTGAIYVPARTAAGPFLRRDAVLHLQPGKTTTVNIRSYVADGAGKPVILTSTTAWSSSGDVESMVSNNSSTSFKVTAGSSAGVGQVSFPVTDGPSSTSTSGSQAMITLPVVIGDPQPVLHCPDAPVTVFGEGVTVPVNVAQYCHVWTADPAAAGKLAYTVSSAHPAGLHPAASGGTVKLWAGAGVPGLDCTRPSTAVSGSVMVAAPGAAPSKLNVSIRCLPLATFTTPPPRATTTKSPPLAIDLTNNVSTKLAVGRQHIEVLSVAAVKGAPPHGLRVVPGTAKLTFNAQGQHGKFRYLLTLDDAGTDKARIIHGTIEIDVIGAPGAPRNVQWVRRGPNDLLSGAVKLSFDPPVDDGNDPNGISEYLVAVNGGSPRSYGCKSSPCQVTGLNNNSDISLTVYSRNSVDRSPTGTTIRGVAAGVLPTAPLNPRIITVTNQAATIAWSPPACAGGRCGNITGYDLTYSGGSGPAQSPTPSVVVHGTNGTPVKVTISARNAVTDRLRQLGVSFAQGAPVSQTVTPAWHPATPQFGATTPLSPPSPSASVDVQLNWGAVAANGPGYDATGSPYYRVTSTNTFDGSPVCAQVTTTSCKTSVPSDGHPHPFYLWVWNTGGKEGPPESSTSNPADYRNVTPGVTTVYGAAKPEPVTNVSVRPSGSLYTATASLTYGASHDSSSDVYCRVGSMSGPICGHWTGDPAGGVLSNRTIDTAGAMGQLMLFFYVQNTGKGIQGVADGDPGTHPVDIYGTPGASIDQLSPVPGTTNVQWHVTVSPEGRDVDWTLTDVASGQTVGSGTAYQSNGQGQGYGNTYPEPSWNTTYQFRLTVVGHSPDVNGGPDPHGTDQRGVTTSTQPPPPYYTETCYYSGGCNVDAGGPDTAPVFPTRVAYMSQIHVTCYTEDPHGAPSAPYWFRITGGSFDGGWTPTNSYDPSLSTNARDPNVPHC